MTKTKILLIGCGNLGRSLLNMWAKQANLQQVVVVQPSLSNQAQFAQVKFITFVNHSEAIAEDFQPDLVVLAFKPYHVDELVHYQRYVNQAVVISLLAGTHIARIAGYCQQATSIVRVMPNLAMQVGHSVNLLYADDSLPTAVHGEIEQLFALTGAVVWLNDEKMVDLLTPIASSGLAYFLLLAHLLEKAAIELGLEPGQAKSLVQQTLLGSTMLAAKSPQLDFDHLVAQVACSKGATEAALEVLRPGLTDLFDQTLHAALKRIEQLRSE